MDPKLKGKGKPPLDACQPVMRPLSIDTAIPCGLILNEMLSNIYKYAFPDRRRGHVNIGLVADGAGRLTLTVEDDGVGAPPGFDVQRTQSLGLLITRSLAEQLGGSLEHEPGAGAKFIVCFPEFQEAALG